MPHVSSRLERVKPAPDHQEHYVAHTNAGVWMFDVTIDEAVMDGDFLMELLRLIERHDPSAAHRARLHLVSSSSGA